MRKRSVRRRLFGYSHLYGSVPGGQAELVRVPNANVGPLPVPDVLADGQLPFLSDILPTGYQAVLNAGIGEGSTLAIFGAGPVGCMAAACAHMLGVETIFMIDHDDYRLAFAKCGYQVAPITSTHRMIRPRRSSRPLPAAAWTRPARRHGQRARRVCRLHPRFPVRRRLRQGADLPDGPDPRPGHHAGVA
jgi:threonine dehydrogenase-like Zn-dependent dehydrogenase